MACASPSQKSVEYFQQSVEKDPAFALGYVGLAESYDLLSTYLGVAPEQSSLKARAAANKALELDETLAEAHTSLAAILWFLMIGTGRVQNGNLDAPWN